jgi:hypothetical protein
LLYGNKVVWTMQSPSLNSGYFLCGGMDVPSGNVPDAVP